MAQTLLLSVYLLSQQLLKSKQHPTKRREREESDVGGEEVFGLPRQIGQMGLV